MILALQSNDILYAHSPSGNPLTESGNAVLPSKDTCSYKHSVRSITASLANRLVCKKELFWLSIGVSYTWGKAW